MKIHINKGFKWALRHWKTLAAVFVTGAVISVATENEYQKGLEDGSLADAEGVKHLLRAATKSESPLTTKEACNEYKAGVREYFDNTYGK